MHPSTETGGRDGYLFGILIDPNCSQIFKIKLTAPPVKAPYPNKFTPNSFTAHKTSMVKDEYEYVVHVF